MKKLVIFATAATIGVVSLSTVTAVANAAPASPTTSKVQWGSCASASLQAAGAQCALLPVPLDYRHPHGTMIKLAISRIKHTVSDAKAQGLMLVNPGGPGGSGLSLSRLGAFVPKHAGDYYDWVGFDPRGVGSSQPAISCDPNYFGYNRPSYVPYTQALVDTWLARSRAYTAACAAKNGPILQHMTTVEAALDMDSIRRALGYKEINYYGFSYGTYLGQVYSTMFPGRVRRQVLDSNVDPRRVWYAANLDQDIAFEKNMKIWWAWVAKYDSVYHLGTTEAVVEALFYKIQDQLLKHPDQGKLGPDEWTDAFLYAGYYQVTWLDLGTLFSNYVHKHDTAAVLQAYANSQGLGDDNGFAVYAAVQCTDAPWPQQWSVWARDNWATYKQARFETWANAWYNAPCLTWPARSHYPLRIDGSRVRSTLLIDETLDAATPYTGSLEVRRLFPHSSLIALPGGTSHANSLGGDACLDNQIADYLISGILPRRQPGSGADTTCAPLPVPVPTAAAAATVSGSSSTSARHGLLALH